MLQQRLKLWTSKDRHRSDQAISYHSISSKETNFSTSTMDSSIKLTSFQTTQMECTSHSMKETISPS